LQGEIYLDSKGGLMCRIYVVKNTIRDAKYLILIIAVAKSKEFKNITTLDR
jgi:hypothetical protein